MEPVPENEIAAQPPLPHTPKPKQHQAYTPPVVQSTPSSKRFTSHAEDEVPKVADIVNKFLEDDISDRLEISLNDFATLILDLPADWHVRKDFTLLPEGEAVKDAFAAYVKVAIGEVDSEGKKKMGIAGNERGLYQPLANLLNSLRDGEGRLGKDIDEKIFYVQDPRPVLGSLSARKPDLGGIYAELLNLSENEKLSDHLAENQIVGVFWGLLLYFIEVKHERGRFVGLNVNKEEGFSSRTQSDTVPSIAYMVSRSSTASTPPSTPSASTSSSDEDEYLPGVAIQNRGGRKKRVEIVTSQEYLQRADAERKAEKMLTPTQGQHLTRIQCASYAKEMLSNGFIRNHAVGITADDTSFRFQYYDRSKVVESKPFGIVNDEFKKLFMAMVCQLNKLSTENLGFIPNLDLDGFDLLRNPEQLSYSFDKDPSKLVGATYTFTGTDGSRRRVRITKILYRAEGIIGRCSIVVEVECLCKESDCTWHEKGKKKMRSKKKVMKISFPSKTRPSEDGLIGEARSKAESSGDTWALNHLPEVIDSITFPYHEENTVQGRLKKHLKENYEERVMRVTFLETLHPLSELKDPREIAQVFYDVLQIHQWLYERVGILHRDLSSGNIMFRRIDGKIYGVLNDFDLSSRVRDMDNGPTSNQRTGTRPFMSLDLLDPTWKGGHFYRHDLESLFYIMLCLACRYEEPGVPAPEPRAYSKWFSGSDQDIFDNKNTFLTSPSVVAQVLPIRPYFAHFKPWLNFMHQLFSEGYHARPRLPKEDTDMPTYPALKKHLPSKTLFDWQTLDGNVTYSVLRECMSSFQKEPLDTRWTGFNPDN
ncbi:protein kinase [Lentinula lateritia]|nr:protein kinase [Lentinula lateritia]